MTGSNLTWHRLPMVNTKSKVANQIQIMMMSIELQIKLPENVTTSTCMANIYMQR